MQECKIWCQRVHGSRWAALGCGEASAFATEPVTQYDHIEQDWQDTFLSESSNWTCSLLPALVQHVCDTRTSLNPSEWRFILRRCSCDYFRRVSTQVNFLFHFVDLQLVPAVQVKSDDWKRPFVRVSFGFSCKWMRRRVTAESQKCRNRVWHCWLASSVIICVM